MRPSPFQQAIFDHIAAQRIGTEASAAGQSHLIIEAVAGSGKTTTIVEALKLTKDRAIFLAFNKSIAEELKKRVPANVQARTFHSLCYNPVLRAIGAREVNPDKLKGLMRAVLTREESEMYGAFVRKLIGLARADGMGCLKPLSDDTLFALVESHDIQLEHEEAEVSVGLALAKTVLLKSNDMREADFDDLLYFAVLKGIRLPQFPWVFVDEGQDTNAIQRAILRKILQPGGRMVVVGDAAQAIYGFRGADSDALNLVAESFAPCKRLPLSVTYRCASSIVKRAQEFVPAIEARDGAPAGEVKNVGLLVNDAKSEGWRLSDIDAHDLVVCRNTKPLLDLGYRMLRARIPVRVLGRDIGEGLVALVRKCAKVSRGVRSLDETLEVLRNWAERETQKAIAADNEAKAEAIEDKAGSIEMLAAELPEDQRNVDALIAVIQSLFTDQNSRTTLATIHKAKGLESERVWWLCPSLCPSKWARKDWQQQQERNLQYVAITRAKQTLIMAELPRKGA